MKFRMLFRLLLTLACCTTLTWAAQETASTGDGGCREIAGHAGPFSVWESAAPRGRVMSDHLGFRRLKRRDDYVVRAYSLNESILPIEYVSSGRDVGTLRQGSF